MLNGVDTSSTEIPSTRSSVHETYLHVCYISNEATLEMSCKVYRMFILFALPTGHRNLEIETPIKDSICCSNDTIRFILSMGNRDYLTHSLLLNFSFYRENPESICRFLLFAVVKDAYDEKKSVNTGCPI